MHDAQKSSAGLISQSDSLDTSILSSLPIGIALLSRNFDILYANFCAKKILGDVTSAKAIFGNYCDAGSWTAITSQIEQAIKSNKSCGFENVSFPLSSSPRLLQITFAPLSQPADQAYCLLTIQDRTDFAHMEQQLATAQKLAAIGKMAAKVAHELNNPMDGVLRYMSLAIRIIEVEKLDKPLEYLLNCKKALLRMVQIISELLEYSRNASASYGQHDTEMMLEEAIKSNETRLAPIKVVRDYSLKGLKTGGPNLYQVFCNLIKNAAEAMPQGGTLAISTQLEEHHVKITIQDTGPGISHENLQKIFEPFFTTKAAIKGTGLGLAICKDIVERYAGTITAANAPLGGCVFEIKLPAGNKDEQ